MKKFKKIMLIFFLTLVVLALGVFVFMRSAVFGADPSGERLARLQQSTHYKDGVFQNLHPTEVMRKEASMSQVMYDFFFGKPKNLEPDAPLPSVKTNLHALSDEEPQVVWFGHSSYLIQHQGTTLLIDPVFSGNAAPVSFFAKAFKGTNTYQAADMPEIDLLIITHDHYDHLDYATILQLHPKVKQIYTSLGVGAHLERWGVPAAKIKELDWWETQNLSDSVRVTAAPARHFSGRGFSRGKTLWSSFVLSLNGFKLYLGGDSGYDTHFKHIGEYYGPFDLVFLEAGQYGVNWPYIHMMPEETVQAAQDLKAKVLMPVHWGKFALALHAWDEPISRVTEEARLKGMPVTTPLIGEPVTVGQSYPQTTWWKK